MKFLRRFFKVKKYTFFHYLLLILISTLLFFGIIVFLYQYIIGANETNLQEEDVLQAATPKITNLQSINRYHIEYKDYDNQLKSIRPKGCEGFDDVEPGVTSSMKRLCTRNYIYDNPRTFPNPPFEPWWQEGNRDVFDGFFIGGRNRLNRGELFSFSLEAQNPTFGYRNNPFLERNSSEQPFPLIAPSYGVAKKDMYILNEFERSGNQRISEPIPILTEFNGKPLMFYYGGVYEINKNDRSAYLLTRLFDTYSYYSKLCTSKAIPTSVYQVETGLESRYIFRNPVVTDIREERCRNCTYNSDLTKSCGQDVTGYACKTLGIGLNFPEAFEDISGNKFPSDSNTPNNVWFSNKHTCRKFEDLNSSRYEFNPNIDQLVFKGRSDCAFTPGGACLESGGKRIEVPKKLTQSDVSFQGASTRSSFNCIGFYEGDKCLELIEFGDRDGRYWYRRYLGSPLGRSNPTRETYISPRFTETNNPKYLSRTMNCNSGDACKSEFNLLYPNQFTPFTTIRSAGYELPYFMIKDAYDMDRWNIRAIDYNNNGLVSVYPSALKRSGNTMDINQYSKKVLNPSEVDFTFSDDNYTYAIDINQSNKTFKIHRLYVHSPSGFLDYNLDSTGSVSLGDLPINLIDPQNITVTYSTQSRFDGYNNEYEVEFFDILWSDKKGQVNPRSKLFRFESRRFDPNSSGEFSEIKDNSNEIPTALKNNVILNLKRYPSETSSQSPDNDYYVWVTKDLVYTSDVLKSECVLGTPRIAVTNTSPNSAVTNSWPLPLSQFLGVIPDRIDLRVDTTNGQFLNCFGNRITAANIILNNPNNNSDFSLNARVSDSTIKTNPNNDSILFRPPNILLPGFSYPIKQINFSIAGKNYRFSQPPPNQIFGTRGWMVSTENYLKVNFTKLGQNFPQNNTNNSLQLYVEKLNSNGSVVSGSRATFVKSGPDPIEFSSTSALPNRFYWDNVPFRYKICIAGNQTEELDSSINISNQDYTVTRLDNKCFQFRYLRRVVPQTIVIKLVAIPLSPKGLTWNGNVFLKNASDNRMIFKSSKAFEGALLYQGGTPFPSWNKNYKGSKVSTTFFRNLQTKLNNFQTLNNLQSLNQPATSNFVLLTASNLPIESGLTLPSSHYINTFTTVPASKKYQIIALSKGRGINLDLTNDFIDGASKVKLNKYVFINLDKNIPGRLRLTANCGDPNYSKICQPGFSYNIKGSIIGGGILNFQNMINQISDRIIIHENPDILIHLTKDLRSKKYNLVTNSKVVVRYLD